MGMIKRFLDQDGDQDDAQRNVRPKNTSDDTEAGEPQSLVITIEDSPTVGPLVTTETLVWTPTAPFVVPAVTEHQPPVLTTTSSQSAEPLPILPAPLPTTHAAPDLEAQRERLLGHEDEWIHGETGYHLDQTYDSNWLHLSPKSPKYDNDPPHHTQPADPRLAFRAPEKRDSPVEPSGQDLTRPHQPEPEYDEGPVLLQYPVGDDCFATISVRVERGAKAAARCLPVNVRLKTDYKEVMPDHLGRLVSETVADEKQRLYE
ncbi:hypothetical protein BG005_010712 [Podila minutissima]|nr:hypothetical protein BG005_010712 [Podila minutissima]